MTSYSVTHCCCIISDSDNEVARVHEVIVVVSCMKQETSLDVPILCCRYCYNNNLTTILYAVQKQLSLDTQIHRIILNLLI